MDLSEELRTGASTNELYRFVADLENYPEWLGLVVRAEPESATSDAKHGGGEGEEVGPAWRVELRGRIGPFARSKRLRMVQTFAESPQFVRFEREEIDGRDHAVWRLEARIDPSENGANLTMDLHYGGSRFGPMLAPILRDEIRKGRRALQARFPTTS